MTPAARIAAAIEILTEIGQGNAPADAILADWFRGHRFAGSRDRRAIRDSVYADLRTGAFRRWRVAEAGGDPENVRLRVVAGILDEIPDALASLFSGEGYGPRPLNAEETACAEKMTTLPADAAPDHARANCPIDLYPMFERQWGADAADELAAMNETAPVDLRVNTLVTDRGDARARLSADGYETVSTLFSPHGLRSGIRGNFQQLGAYREGMIEPQDESSQLVAMLVDAAPGQQVIDYCAGAGGKALALAAAAQNAARIVACDSSGARLARLGPRAERLDVQCIETREVPEDGAPDDLTGSADRVRIDAPCSGTGTWRRSPDLRWRTRPGTIEEFSRVQDALLDIAATLVKPEGRIVYAVCSVLAAEGSERVEAFLARTPAFARVPVSGVFGPDLAGRLGLGDDLYLTPHRHGTDGMYAVILEKAS